MFVSTPKTDALFWENRDNILTEKKQQKSNGSSFFKKPKAYCAPIARVH
jgi:hypothetical protein